MWYHNVSTVIFYQYPAEQAVIPTQNVSELKHLAMSLRFAWAWEKALRQQKVITRMQTHIISAI